jgi:DNA polymerase-3 subunit delta
MEKQHSYKKIEKDLKEGSIKNVLLLYGKEQYLVKWAADAASGKYVEDEYKAFDFFVIEPEKATADGIIESCETLSMFSEKRVVYLPDFTPISGGKLKNFPETEEKLLAEYIKDIPDTCLLIISSGNADKRKKLYKEIVSYGGAYDFEPLDEATLKSFIIKRFGLRGKSVKSSVLSEFIVQSGYFHKEADYTLYNLENEINKIAAHCDSDEVQLSDVLAVISGDAETNIFAMIDAASRKKKEEAFRLLYNLLGSDASVFQILSLLASQFETVLEVKELKDEGKRLADMQSVLNIHEFRIKKAASVCDSYSTGRLRDILKKVYQVERDVKTGAMEQVLALEVLISEL